MIGTSTRFQTPRLFLFLSICLISLNSFNVAPTEDQSWRCEDLKYTYQILVSGRYQVQLPITICDDIERGRKDHERVILKYSDYVSIEIFSKDEIEVLNTTTKEIKHV